MIVKPGAGIFNINQIEAFCSICKCELFHKTDTHIVHEIGGKTLWMHVHCAKELGMKLEKESREL